MFDPLEQLGAGRALRIVQRLKALPHELLRQAFFFITLSVSGAVASRARLAT